MDVTMELSSMGKRCQGQDAIDLADLPNSGDGGRQTVHSVIDILSIKHEPMLQNGVTTSELSVDQ
ncbi:hypothetical protein EYZ11_007139 [Aspergillus tanneri]|uniref:Uncharacterized protein n=1 Tax=Aspergillus tanneri TaxID=1220188 RepID=A0A4S3JE25_9EURO|nr:hypothetical protein EYZ11_007139 [Aspergillus tanneri]